MTARTRRLALVRALSAVLALGGVAAACGGGDDSSPPPRPPESYPPELIEQGAEVYRTTCSACHGAEGEGGIGLPLIGVTARKSVEEHRAIVTDGRGASMPPFGASLTPEEIEAVIAYERTAFE